MSVFELAGVAGIAISVLAYLPQVVHLAREHCSAGVSRRSWAMWVVASLLIGLLAFHRHDLVFILLQVSSLTSAAIILLLAHRYRGMVCETHARGYPEARIAVRARPARDGAVSRLARRSRAAKLGRIDCQRRHG
jgi:lipid-A-disaccharide synthase-like uncharacterized protein